MILGKVLDLGTYLCTVVIVILAYLPPGTIITLYMLQGNLTSIDQSMEQLEAFIFFHALKEEEWVRG